MKGTITKLVSIDYDGPEEKARAVEQFHLFGSTDKAKVENVVMLDERLWGYRLYKVTGLFKKRKK